MKTLTQTLEYATLVTRLGCWLALFAAGCLVSAECRKIRAELREAGDTIDPVKPLVARLDALHADLFGSN